MYMINIIYFSLYILFRVLEIVLFLYIMTSWFPISPHIKNLLNTLMAPILDPVRYLLRHSIFNTPRADISPVIGFVIIKYLQEFFLTLK